MTSAVLDDLYGSAPSHASISRVASEIDVTSSLLNLLSLRCMCTCTVTSMHIFCERKYKSSCAAIARGGNYEVYIHVLRGNYGSSYIPASL